MKSFLNLVQEFDCTLCENTFKYSPAGNLLYSDNENYQGYYWFYESDDFIVDIHDFFIKKDYIVDFTPDLSPYLFLISDYLISGSGEWFTPYQSIGPNTVFIMDANFLTNRYILHGGCYLHMVGIKFKYSIIEDYIIKPLNIPKNEVSQIFFETRNDITKSIGKIAHEIMDCKMSGTSAELFFDAKAKEWLSITLDSYAQNRTAKPLTATDKSSIENVANYINDHYAFDISQELLEKISLMSGTKLKTTFRQHYHMSITEFTQRKRMNIAENLLLTTGLEIRDIAKSVGYNSPSRFTAIFKRYKGVYPKDLRNDAKKNMHISKS